MLTHSKRHTQFVVDFTGSHELAMAMLMAARHPWQRI